jgi:anti-sigma factor RsiW
MPFSGRRRPLVCRDAVALMTAHLEGVLPARDRERLDAHLTGCPDCAGHLAQLRVTVDALGRIEPDDVTDASVDELVGHFRRWTA